MTWSPISLDELSKLIYEGETKMNGDLRSFWEQIKIKPEKWQEQSYGQEGNGFWIVGIIGQQILWYNDIEEGFNTSSYSQFGGIGEYVCNQDTLDICVSNIFKVFRK
jgi:hypothetical protein